LLNRDQAIDDLLAKEEIRQAMARYARGIDRLDESLVQTAYHPDSRDDHGWGLAGSGYDIAALVRRDGKGLPEERRTTTHFLGNHLIEVDGDKAVSEVYFISYQLFDDDTGVEWSYTVGGRYLDGWEKREGEAFRISRRTVVYDWIRTEPNRTPWPGPDHDVPKMFHGGPPFTDLSTTTFGRTGQDDPSYGLLEFSD
jgi:hypothetical protein